MEKTEVEVMHKNKMYRWWWVGWSVGKFSSWITDIFTTAISCMCSQYFVSNGCYIGYRVPYVHRVKWFRPILLHLGWIIPLLCIPHVCWRSIWPITCMILIKIPLCSTIISIFVAYYVVMSKDETMMIIIRILLGFTLDFILDNRWILPLE